MLTYFVNCCHVHNFFVVDAFIIDQPSLNSFGSFNNVVVIVLFFINRKIILTIHYTFLIYNRTFTKLLMNIREKTLYQQTSKHPNSKL